MKRKKAFTLVEVLIVLSIMGVIMSLLLGAVLKARGKVKLSKVHVLMDSISAALRMYADDFGDYPPDNSLLNLSNPSSAECLYYYLGATFIRGRNSSVNAGPYMRFKGEELRAVADKSSCDFDGDGFGDDPTKEIIDPWENKTSQNPDGKQILIYHKIPTHNPSLNKFELYSIGPNGVNDNGSGDDVTNWS
ncbi:MAG: prepilin-type N-terminal cleavage/methylation domain-containing protein [Chlamydiae bacterium]|nr:prepilin-type N-terminal cleavage/methylation domain-containing protein [Chlamydiota bacterium]MBI3278171.1 prepilin-type N-terminal cleavage/methylation domain-containing protein [Chlamydiota bacterium]